MKARPPGILALLIVPAVVFALGMTLLCAYAEQYVLTAYCAGGLVLSCAALRWLWGRT